MHLLSRFRLALVLGLAALLVFSIFYLPALAEQDSEAAFEAKADKVLKVVRRAAEHDRAEALGKGRLRDEDSEVARLSKLAGVRRGRDGRDTVGVLVELTSKSVEELQAAGFPVGTRVGQIATVETDIERLPELAALSSVRKVTAATVYHTLNDRARKAVGIDNAAGQRVVSQTGKGVVVGIVDTGIDIRHLDFTVPGSGGKQTRIKALLDMTGVQTPDPNWNYTLPGGNAPVGRLYTEADINTALQGAGGVNEKDWNGHGTHVAGTAAGNGLAAGSTVYAGMAPEADLVIVKASRQSNGQDNFRTDDVLNALQFIQQKASELGEPFVVNMSIGGHGGSPHDGTDPEEKAIDAIVGSGPGRVICVAAGNEGNSGIHASGNVPSGGNLTLSLTAQSSPQSFTLYYPNNDRFGLTVTLPNGTKLSSGSFNGPPASNTYLTIYSGTDDKQDSDPANDQSSLFVIFKPGAENLGTNWSFALNGTSVNSGGHFDAWVDDGVFASPYVDDAHLVGSPGTARGAITVGAFVTRSASQPIGIYAPFTSPGPTADGRQKPEISAPGYYLYSARSADIESSQFGTTGTGDNAPLDDIHYAGLAGTSMATPVATGSVALLLQVNPAFSAAQVKSYLTTNANHDSYAPAGWTPQLGFGKLNIAAALTAAGGNNPAQTYSVSGHVVEGAVNGPALSGVTLTLVTVGSQAQPRTAQSDANGDFAISNVPKGSYMLSATDSRHTFSNPYSLGEITANVTMQPIIGQIAYYPVTGYVRDAYGDGVSGISLTLKKEGTTQTVTATTGTDGSYWIDKFAVASDTYTLTPARTNWNFTPASQTFTNSNTTGSAFGINFSMTPANPIDDTQTFVTWHYRDFLNREPDSGGLGYWSSQFTKCGTDELCLHKRRIAVSAAFFIELEFQQTGSFVYRLYKGTLNRRPTFVEFNADRSKVTVGPALEQSKDALAQEFVARSEFKQIYLDSMSATDFVNKLYEQAGLTGYAAERQQQALDMQGGKARWQVVREVIELTEFRNREYNPSFVLMQYFGYLQRDPDEGGFLFWLNILNNKLPQDSSGYKGMVCAFITSAEYQKRFGTIVTRSDRSCR
ncbi:MAG TPA: S8 family serine peptidase [Pyrinomonadaceae bacterium]|jgi:subtilisin family serine protease